MTGAVLAAVALAVTLWSEEFRLGIVGAGVFLFAAMVYYFAYSRHRLVAQAPEEEVALIQEAQRDLR